MSADRQEQIEALYHGALARPADARATFLVQACGDDHELRREVESLLAHVGSGDGFLEPPAAATAPRLTPGQTLGHYTIVGPLGAGGMGEVYRARDTRLGREVAIKVLPLAIAADPDRLRRFEIEARAAAALAHPNIVTIHSVEQAGDLHFLTMELVDGVPLAERIPAGGASVERLLEIAIPLADAVGAAHARGIVHRDLKPANVMIAADGRVKVLDFGLAKLSPLSEAGNLTTHSPAALTAEGHLLGTVAYMSPEQAEGRDVDHRSDIFSLGVLLYELATGKRPFKGDSSLSLLSSILKDTPPSISELKPALPRELGRIIRRCLVKDPDRRYQSARDLRNELEELKQELDSGALTEESTAKATRGFPGRPAWTAAVAALAVVLVVVGLSYLGWRGMSRRTPPLLTRTHILPPAGVRIYPSNTQSIAISPDGLWVAFQGASDDESRGGIYLRSIAEVEARFVLGSGAGTSPFFSPDSMWLAFAANGMMQKVPVGGGHPQRICRVPLGVRGASWGDDGSIVFSIGEGLLRVQAEGGEPVRITTPAPGDRHYWPQVLPGSRAAIFTLYQGASDDRRKIAVVSLVTGKLQVLAALTGTHPRYQPSGHLLYARFGTLYAATFDLRYPEAVGQPQPVLGDVYFNLGTGYTAFDVAGSGSLVYVPGAQRLEESELLWLDRQGQVISTVGRKMFSRMSAIALAGDRVAVVISTSLEDHELWVHDTRPGRWSQLTTGYKAGDPVWSPDGKWLVFSSSRSGNGLFRVLADGSGDPEQLRTGVEYVWPGGFSPNGTVLAFMRNTRPGEWDLMTLSLDRPGADPEPFLQTSNPERHPAFSPDGHWIAYDSNETGSRQIHVRPYGRPGDRVTVSTGGGWTPVWRADGRELFYRRDWEVWSVRVEPGLAFRAGTPQRLFRAEFLSNWPDSRLAVSEDGRRFLVIGEPPRERTEPILVYAPSWVGEANRTPQR